MLTTKQLEIIDYPAGDGEPMAETGIHVLLIVHLIAMLRAFFRQRNDVYVSGNMFMFYEEGDPTQRVAPDTFVVFGTSQHERRSWFVWQEGKAPDVVFEFTSRGTRAADLGAKKGLYEWLGVREYFLFDPLEEYLHPSLQGFHLVRGEYEPIPLIDNQLESAQMGLRLQAAGQRLELLDAQTGARLLSPEEETEARRAAEAEVVRLREELARLRQQD